LRDQRLYAGLGLVELFGEPFYLVGLGRDILAQVIVLRTQSVKQRDEMIEPVFKALKILFHAVEFSEKTLQRQWLSGLFESFFKFGNSPQSGPLLRCAFTPAAINPIVSGNRHEPT
jgi:hypothetical protein